MSTVLLGVFSGRRADGHRLHDGNAAAVRAGAGEGVVAIAEERLSRRKHAEGFARASRYCLEGVGYRPARDDLVVGFSSALDRPWPAKRAERELEHTTGLVARSVHVFDHHLAHAAAAFATSGLDGAHVLVVDSRGNFWPDRWQCQTSYRVTCDPAGTACYEVVDPGPMSGLGWGQLWRAATKWAGFPSYHDASKLMALAGVAAGRGAEPLWDPSDAALVRRLLDGADPLAPVSGLDRVLQGLGISPGPRAAGWYAAEHWARHGRDTVREVDLALALAVQQSYERWLTSWADRAGGGPVALGGGVAMNCVAVGAAADRGHLHVPCAPGDDGQALGVLSLLAGTQGLPSALERRATLGRAYDGELPAGRLHGWRRSRSPQETAVELLEAGHVVARVHGGAEYGPRALGGRSLLAGLRPEHLGTGLQRLRRIKEREDYQPFAATVTNRATAALGLPASPYMSFAARLETDRLPPELGGIAHDDGTLRYQTLEPADDPALDAVLEQLGTGLVNTSLNRRSTPLVETPDEAADLVAHRPEITALWCGDTVHVRPP